MKMKAGVRIAVVAVLGVVAFLLVANLVSQFREFQPGFARTSPTPAAPAKGEGKGAARAGEGLAQFDPTVHFDAWKELEARSLPDEDRNPFEFVGGQPIMSPKQIAAAQKAAPPPPPPPPPPIKAAGYNELPGGGKEAMVSYNDDIVVVHEGDMIGTKYKVTKITPAMVVVEDNEEHKTLELPFPQ